MDGFVIKTFVSNLRYQQERLDDRGKIKVGLAINVNNEFVYWYKSNNGYPICFIEEDECDRVVKYFNGLPDIYSRIEILECEDSSIECSLNPLDYDIAFPDFLEPVGNNHSFLLPFKMVGKRERIT